MDRQEQEKLNRYVKLGVLAAQAFDIGPSQTGCVYRVPAGTRYVKALVSLADSGDAKTALMDTEIIVLRHWRDGRRDNSTDMWIGYGPRSHVLVVADGPWLNWGRE